MKDEHRAKRTVKFIPESAQAQSSAGYDPELSSAAAASFLQQLPAEILNSSDNDIDDAEKIKIEDHPSIEPTDAASDHSQTSEARDSAGYAPELSSAAAASSLQKLPVDISSSSDDDSHHSANSQIENLSSTELMDAVVDPSIEVAELFLKMAQKVRGGTPGPRNSLDGTVAGVQRLSSEQLAEFEEITGSILYGFEDHQMLQKDGTSLRSAVSLRPPEQVFRAFAAAMHWREQVLVDTGNSHDYELERRGHRGVEPLEAAVQGARVDV